MADSDSDERSGDEAEGQRADQTLMGVAPPKVETTAEEPRHSPVQVRSGTLPDEPSAPVKAALPSRPPPPSQRRASTAPPPPPPVRRSQRPSATPPPPPVRSKPPGVFSVPPPAPVAAPPAPVAAPPAPVAAPPVAAPPVVAPPVVAPPVVAPPVAAPAVAAPPVAIAPVAPVPSLPSAVEAPAAVAAAPHVSGVTDSALPPPAPPAPGAFVASAAPPLVLGTTEEPRWLVIARAHPVLWMVGAPMLVSLLLVTVLYAIGPEPREEPPPSVTATNATPAAAAAASPREAAEDAAAAEAPQRSSAATLEALEAKAPESLTAAELLALHEARAERDRDAIKSLARKLQESPELAQDTKVRAKLLRAAADGDKAREALAAMMQAESPIAADLLYEVWVARSTPADVAELAGQLLQSAEMKSKASPALAAVLELRQATTCEQAQASLTGLKQDGDRRALPALAKLNARKGCGPKKNQDCFACLRDKPKELAATVNAVKARKAPSYP